MKFSKKLHHLIDFIEFTHEFREVIRVARTPNGKQYENDSEHSYQLAMVAWYIIDSQKLRLNKEKCLMYALAHDLVEVYAGDTYSFGHPALHASKAKREHQALLKIKKRFPSFKTLATIIERYEKRRDPESKLVYALDKLIPPIQIYLEGGKLWKEHHVTMKMLVENKGQKIAVSKIIEPYWKELLEALTNSEKKFF